MPPGAVQQQPTDACGAAGEGPPAASPAPAATGAGNADAGTIGRASAKAHAGVNGGADAGTNGGAGAEAHAGAKGGTDAGMNGGAEAGLDVGDAANAAAAAAAAGEGSVDAGGAYASGGGGLRSSAAPGGTHAAEAVMQGTQIFNDFPAPAKKTAHNAGPPPTMPPLSTSGRETQRVSKDDIYTWRTAISY